MEETISLNQKNYFEEIKNDANEIRKYKKKQNNYDGKAMNPLTLESSIFVVSFVLTSWVGR